MLDFTKARPVRILLLGSDPQSIATIGQYLADQKVKKSLNLVFDFQQLDRFLQSRSEYQFAFEPDMLILDLDGFHTSEIRFYLAYLNDVHALPVAALTSDLSQLESIPVFSRLSKPLDINELYNSVKKLDGVWTTFLEFEDDNGITI